MSWLPAAGGARLWSGSSGGAGTTSAPHLHIIALDGAFAEQPDGSPRFVQLPALASIDVAEVLLTIRCRVLRLLARRGVIETPDDLELLPSDAAERDPVLAQLTAEAPAGPERCQSTPLRLVHGKAPPSPDRCAWPTGACRCTPPRWPMVTSHAARKP